MDHSVFLMDGSNHSYQRALHCLGVFRTRREDIRALERVSRGHERRRRTYHWFLPYFAMAALRTSSSVFCRAVSWIQEGQGEDMPSRHLGEQRGEQEKPLRNEEEDIPPLIMMRTMVRDKT